MHKLTEFSSSSGCGCKVAPAVLQQIIGGLDKPIFDNLLVGNQTNDDAAVWNLDGMQSMINTVDFFMPIVNDAFDFGKISATNAISDIYAMGATPVFANAILGWPVDNLPTELASKVILGAQQICKEANIPLAGGHTIVSKEPFFGLSVNGLVQNKNLKKNNTATDGCVLFLTKPIGTGIVATAIKRDVAKPEHVLTVTESMCKLNKIGEELAKINAVKALTDITGFGLLGHLIEMAQGSGLSATLNFNAVKIFDFLDDYLEQNIIPDNTYRNWNAYEKLTIGINDIKQFQLLNDPQTSGGLLIAVEPNGVKELQDLLVKNNLHEFVNPIGQLTQKTNFVVNVV